MNKYYIKEYKKTQLDKVAEEKANLDVEKLRNEYFDYPTTKLRAKWSFNLSIISLVIATIAALAAILRAISSK